MIPSPFSKSSSHTQQEIAQRLGDLTLELCRIPSVTGDERIICDQLESWCKAQFPGQVRRLGNSLVAGSFDDPRPTVLLVGHIDTVPPHQSDGPARIEEQKVFGRGASDMKGGVAVLMALVENLDRAQLPYNLAIILYDREEGPYDLNGLGPVLSAMPELQRCALCFILESTNNEVQMGCTGSMHARVTFRGKSAHSARPWEGKNAIHLAAPLLTALAQRERRRVEVAGYEYFEVLSATLARGGAATNVVPDSFELNLNYRFAPGRSLDDAEKELRDLVGDQAEINMVDRSPSGRVCADNPLMKRFLELTGAVASPKQAWTDVARMGVWNIDAVNFGPGLTSQAHQAGEYIPLVELERGYRMLHKFLITA